MSADVEGVARLVSTLDQAATDIEDLTDGRRAAGQVLEDAGRATSPRLSGALAATVTYQLGPGLVALTAGSSTVRYAGKVHARKPWLRQAVQDHRQDVLDAYTEDVQQALSQVKGA